MRTDGDAQGPSLREVTRALARAERGVALDTSEATALLYARGAELERLLVVASRTRDQGLQALGRPGVITYSRKVFIPLTRLCRDHCHYCTFATDPASLRREGHGMFLSPDEVLEIATKGAALGCKEALFTLGDRPEDRWPAAREWLAEAGYDDTLSYLRAMAVLVLEQTGLLPHLNPGVMSWEEIARLRPVAPSMGMMLETTSSRLFTEPGMAHFGSPDKDPVLRLRVLADAGRQAVPFTTGILVGIGETPAERVDALLAIRASARSYGHVQECIVQNFRAKPDTAMRHEQDLDLTEYAATLAVARLLLGPRATVQAPPNLSDPAELSLLLRAGVDDWGGVSPLTPDHVNPERPWPHLQDLAQLTARSGFTLRERLTAHPSYVLREDPWLDPQVRRHVRALAGVDGLAAEGVRPAGLPWQADDDSHAGSYDAFAATSRGRVDLHESVDTTGRTADRRSDFDEVYGDWAAIGEQAAQVDRRAPVRLAADERAALALAADDPGALAAEPNFGLALALMHADGPALEVLAGIADDLRRDTVGEDVTYVVNRNINFTNVCYTGCRFCAFAQRRTDADAYTLSRTEFGDRVEQAWAVGATEVCVQGGIHPDLPGTAYFDLLREAKARVPGIHFHGFSPMEIVNGATRSGRSVRDWLTEAKDAGLDSIPGTAAEILDDEVRWVLTKGKLPTASWIEVVTTAHSLGIPSSSTMMYGHVDAPRHWVAHLALLRRLQQDSGGFTEFVALPFIHHNAPVYLAGLARPGPTPRDNRVVHAMARVMLHGAIDHVQTSWVKLGASGVRVMLGSGADDLGGTLMEETISRMAGSEHGSRQSVADLVAMAAAAGRPARQRTTTYGTVGAERTAAARRSVGLEPVGVGPARARG
ncbi:MAG TPA: bifunctional FO biosynthesis protein CofGH [Candidatus Nanopelagicales bacterium]|nr:bifunctional FO biosynthesis protein CofGH [Candidatus Nanopelagicales bacterium]